MARVIAIRRKRTIRTTRSGGRGVTIAVRGVDIRVKTSRNQVRGKD